MPFTLDVDHPRYRSKSVITGVMDFEESLRFIQERVLFGCLGYPLLIDARAGKLALSGRDIVRLLPHLQKLVEIAPLAQTAVVVADKSNWQVVQLVGCTTADLCTVRPFRTFEEAERWLGWTDASPTGLVAAGAMA